MTLKLKVECRYYNEKTKKYEYTLSTEVKNDSVEEKFLDKYMCSMQPILIDVEKEVGA